MGASNHPTDASGRVVPEASWPAGREAPPDLERVRRLCNTQNLESGGDILTTSAELKRWLATEGFGRNARLDQSDLDGVQALRAAVRALVREPPGAAGAVRAAKRLDASLAHVHLVARLNPRPHFAPVRSGVDAYFAAIAQAIFIAHHDNTWTRLKACGHCQWVIYDRSYNRSGSWCSTKACGSRLKARAWRARQKERAEP